MEWFKRDYKLAQDWILELLHELGLSSQDLIICPGNHDLNRNVVNYDRPKSAIEADELLEIENIHNKTSHILTPFDNYVSFCKKLDVPPFKLGNKQSYLCGYREIYGLRFIALNSAWFCQGNDDRGNLFIGLP